MKIEKKLIEEALDKALKTILGDDAFAVGTEIDTDDNIVIAIDTLDPAGIDIDSCAEISRAVAAAIDAVDPEADYAIEVGSAGLTAPFTVFGQWKKNIGQGVEILTNDGRKIKATLKSAEQAPDGSVDAVVTTVEKIRPEGAKRPVATEVDTPINSKNIKLINAEIKF